MMTCKGRGAQQKHQAKHQGGGLPFRIHGFSSIDELGRPFANENAPAELHGPLSSGIVHSNFVIGSQGRANLLLTRSSDYGTWC